MNTDQFQRVQNFFDTMPKLRKRIMVTNPKTKKEGEVMIEGMQNFLV
jgi:hypothetical protein